MPLLQSLEDDRVKRLKSLKYGDGLAPYVQKDILDPPKYNALSTPITRRIDDVERMGKMLIDTPGIKWGLKQGALETQKAIYDNLRETAPANRDQAGRSRTFDALGSIIAQIPTNGTGTHFAQRNRLDRYAFGVEGAAVAPFTTNIPIPFEGMSQLVDGNRADYPLTKQSSLPNEIEGRKTVVKYNTETPYRVSLTREGKVHDGKTAGTDKLKYEIKNTIETNYGFNGSDEINLLDVNQDSDLDIIPFKFKIINADNPTLNTVLVFRSYLTNISDQFGGSWNEVNYNGRGESFHTYNKFTRTLSFNFKVALFNTTEQQTTYNKINVLQSTTAPTYSQAGFMRGTLVRLTIGDYVNNLPGFVTSVGTSIETDVPWEIARNADGTRTENTLILPHVISFQIAFTPIHEFIPQTSFTSGRAQDNILRFIG